jgi:hypothetical protein
MPTIDTRALAIDTAALPQRAQRSTTRTLGVRTVLARSLAYVGAALAGCTALAGAGWATFGGPLLATLPDLHPAHACAGIAMLGASAALCIGWAVHLGQQ